MYYVCPRCGFDTNIKLIMKDHLSGPTKCDPILTNDNLQGYKKMIFQIPFNRSCCLLCTNEYTSRFGWSVHMKECPKFLVIHSFYSKKT